MMNRTMATKQFSAVEMAELTKLVFKEHGPDLPTVIASTFFELINRCAELEARVEKLEAKRR